MREWTNRVTPPFALVIGSFSAEIKFARNLFSVDHYSRWQNSDRSSRSSKQLKKLGRNAEQYSAFQRLTILRMVSWEPAVRCPEAVLVQGLVLLVPPKPVCFCRRIPGEGTVSMFSLEIELPPLLPRLQRHVDFRQGGADFFKPSLV